MVNQKTEKGVVDLLFQPFRRLPAFIELRHFLLQAFLALLVILFLLKAPKQLLVCDDVCESPHWGGKVRVR